MKKKKLKQKVINSFKTNNSKNNNDLDSLNGIELKENYERNDSSTNLTSLKPIEISSPSNNNE